jgi:hypothetical protein
MPKETKNAKKINPYILKDAELMPCEYCKYTRKAHNNITSMIDDKNLKIKENKNNISQKQIFGTEPKKNKKSKGKKKKY